MSSFTGSVHFEWGLYFYKRTIGMDAEAPKVKPFLDEHDLNTPLSFIGKLPGVSTVVNVLKGADEAQAWLRNLYKPHDDIREKFDALTYKEQEEELPRLFAENLNAYTEKSSTPLVFLLDTYEYITKHNKQGSTQGRDWWLHGEGSLISLSKNTLWVIAGRHKIQWEEEDDTIEQHMLGSLSEEDAASFLAGAGIPEDLIPGLYKLTTGTPIFLDVCVDLYYQLWEKDKKIPELSQFGLGNSYRLIECYLKYMDPRVKEMVYMLSYIPQWDKELVQSAAKEVLGEFHIAEFNQVKKLSITELKEESLYQIHGAVAEHLRNNPENELREDTARFLINHFLPVLDTASAYSEEYSRALKNVLYGGMLQYQDRKDRTKLADFYLSTMQEPQNHLCRCHRSEVAEDLLAPFLERAQEEPSDFLYASALYEKAWHTYQRYDGNPHLYIPDDTICDIIAWAMESLHLLQKNGKEDRILVPQALEAMAVYLDVLNYEPDPDDPLSCVRPQYGILVVGLHQYAVHLYKTRHSHDPIALLGCRRHLALTYQRAGNYDAAVALLRENLELAEETLESGNRHRLQALQDLADFYHHHGDVEEALEHSKQALKQKTAHLPEGNPDTIRSMIALADLYQKMSNLPEEAKVREQVLRLCRKHLPADHPDMDDAIRSLADTYKKLQEYSKELPLREELLERLPAEYPYVYSKSHAVLGLARVYHNLQRWDKRNDLCISWCSLWAVEYFRVARDLMESVCDSCQDYSLGKQLLQILTKTPVSPEEEIRLKISWAICCYDCGEAQKALDILEEIRKTEPEDSILWHEALDRQIRIRQAIGQTDLAQELEEVLKEAPSPLAKLIEKQADFWSGPRLFTMRKDARAEAEIKKYTTPTDFTGLSLQEVLVGIYLKMPLKSIAKLSASVANELEEQARLYVQQLPTQGGGKFYSPDYSELDEETIKTVRELLQEFNTQTEDTQ